MSNWIHELRISLRSLRRDGRFTSLVLLYLVLGIGGNAVIFTAVDNMLLDNLPDFEDADELVIIWDTYTRPDGSTSGGVLSSPMTYFSRLEKNHSLDDIAAIQHANFIVTGDGEPEEIRGSSVTGNLLSMLGVRPLRGRHFSEEESRPGGNNRVVIMNERLWRTRYGSSEDVLGKTLTLDGEPFTVIGIVPGRFQGLYLLGADLWVPLALDRTDVVSAVTTVGRLKQGVDYRTAESDLQIIAKQDAKDHPETHGGWGARVRLISSVIVSGADTKLITLQLVTLFVLLIVCVNIGNLFLARSEERLHETAIRTALGAGRRQIYRQLFTESLVLSLVGGGLALIVAFAVLKSALGSKLLSTFALVPRQFFIKPSVFLFIFGLTLLVAIFFCLVPAMRTSHVNQIDVLKGGGGSRGGSRKHRLLNTLVIAEIALAIMMLTGAGLMLRSLNNLGQADPGFEKQDRLMAQIRLPRFSYTEPQRRHEALHGMLDRVKAVPGVEQVGITTRLPLFDEELHTEFNIEGQPPEDVSRVPKALTASVSHDFLEVMEIPLVAGRTFRLSDDHRSTPVAVINRSLAEQLWPDGNAIGTRVQPGAVLDPDGFFLTVIGVVEDIHFLKLDREKKPMLYLPLFQMLTDPRAVAPRLVLETSTDSQTLISAVRSAIREVDPVLAIQRIATVEELVAESYDQQATGLAVIGLCATLALLLAAVGVYGMISYIYARRAREIGIHIAVGAQPKDVVRRIVKHGVRLSLIGLGFGLVGAFLLGRLLRSQLYNVGAADPVSLAGASLGLVVIALTASFFSARRATKINPVDALRQE